MTVFIVPAEAQRESGCFSVLDQTHSQELMFIPDGAVLNDPFDGYMRFLEDRALSSLPFSEKTLIPETLAEHLPENPVYISSRITEGKLHEILMEKQQRYQDRLWFFIEPYRHFLPLPSPDGSLVEDSMPVGKSFYSDAFYCRYQFDEINQCVHFFDTDETIQKKRILAENAGIAHLVILP